MLDLGLAEDILSTQEHSSTALLPKSSQSSMCGVDCDLNRAGCSIQEDLPGMVCVGSTGWGPLLTKCISLSTDQDSTVQTRLPRCRTSVRHPITRIASAPLPLKECTSLSVDQDSMMKARAPRCRTSARHTLTRHSSAPLLLTKKHTSLSDQDAEEGRIVESRAPRCSTNARHTLARHASDPLHECLTLDRFVGPALISSERLQRATQTGSGTTTNVNLAAVVFEHRLQEGPRQLVQPHWLHASSISRAASTASITKMSSEIYSTPIEYPGPSGYSGNV